MSCFDDILKGITAIDDETSDNETTSSSSSHNVPPFPQTTFVENRLSPYSSSSSSQHISPTSRQKALFYAHLDVISDLRQDMTSLRILANDFMPSLTAGLESIWTRVEEGVRNLDEENNIKLNAEKGKIEAEARRITSQQRMDLERQILATRKESQMHLVSVLGAVRKRLAHMNRELSAIRAATVLHSRTMQEAGSDTLIKAMSEATRIFFKQRNDLLTAHSLQQSFATNAYAALLKQHEDMKLVLEATQQECLTLRTECKTAQETSDTLHQQLTLSFRESEQNGVVYQEKLQQLQSEAEKERTTLTSQLEQQIADTKSLSLQIKRSESQKAIYKALVNALDLSSAITTAATMGRGKDGVEGGGVRGGSGSSSRWSKTSFSRAAAAAAAAAADDDDEGVSAARMKTKRRRSSSGRSTHESGTDSDDSDDSDGDHNVSAFFRGRTLHAVELVPKVHITLENNDDAVTSPSSQKSSSSFHQNTSQSSPSSSSSSHTKTPPPATTSSILRLDPFAGQHVLQRLTTLRIKDRISSLLHFVDDILPQKEEQDDRE